MSLPPELRDEVFRTVKSYQQKRRYLMSKGVSKGALPANVTTKKLLMAYDNSPSRLIERLNQLKKFTTRGEVYRTQGGINVTKKLVQYKNKEIRRGEQYQVDRYNRLKFNKSSTAKDYRKTKVDYLKDKSLETMKYSQLGTVNYSIETPEEIRIMKKRSVENFYKAINLGFEEADYLKTMPEVKKRFDRYLNNFTEDEIADLLSTNGTVKALMNYYRGESKYQPVEFAGESYDDLLWNLYEDLPTIAKGIYKRRKVNAQGK